MLGWRKTSVRCTISEEDISICQIAYKMSLSDTKMVTRRLTEITRKHFAGVRVKYQVA